MYVFRSLSFILSVISGRLLLILTSVSQKSRLCSQVGFEGCSSAKLYPQWIIHIHYEGYQHAYYPHYIICMLLLGVGLWLAIFTFYSMFLCRIFFLVFQWWLPYFDITSTLFSYMVETLIANSGWILQWRKYSSNKHWYRWYECYKTETH